MSTKMDSIKIEFIEGLDSKPCMHPIFVHEICMKKHILNDFANSSNTKDLEKQYILIMEGAETSSVLQIKFVEP